MNQKIKEKIRKSFNNQNFLTLIGVQLESIEHGKVEMSLQKKTDLLQQQGLIHGGVITTIADVAGGYAALSVMPENDEVLTVELKINLLRPASTDNIRVVGEVIKPGRTFVVVQSTVYDENNKEIAVMLATMYAVKNDN